MADKKLTTIAALVAAASLFLGGCDLGNQDGDNPGSDTGNYDDNNGIDTDLGDDSRGNDLEDAPEGDDAEDDESDQ